MNIETVLRPLGELERTLAELYGWYGEVFASDAELAALFSRMSVEEQAHGRLVEYQRRLIRGDAALSVDVEVDVASIREALELARALRNARRPPAKEEAVAASVRLEACAAEAHGRNALKSAVPHVAFLLEALGAEDQLHVQRLRELATRRGVLIPELDALPT